MTEPAAVPGILNGLPIHWQGTDTALPDHTLISTTVLGLATTYILHNGQIIGRIEANGRTLDGYVGTGLKGGMFAGTGDYYILAHKIATQTNTKE